jgi:hypothetical protein
MNTGSTGGGIYQDIPVSISAGDVYCASAFVRTQNGATGAGGTFVLWMLGGSYNENGVAAFSKLSNKTSWSQQQTCVSASTSHSSIRVQFYPTPGGLTLEVDDIDVH